MCLGVPLKVVEIHGKNGIGEINGIQQKIRLDFVENLKIGQYVLVHAGFALQIIEEEIAKETLSLVQEVQNAAESRN